MSDEKTTAEPSGASAGSRGEQCRCNLRTRLVGDGCEHCNPEMMIDILREQIAEMQLTDEEREVLESHMREIHPEEENPESYWCYQCWDIRHGDI
jgi:hypothetical protein